MRNAPHHILRLPRNAIALLIEAYQRTLSPDHGPLHACFPFGVCIHSETCSDYGKRVIRERGVLLGTVQIIWRLLHCTPWHAPDAEKIRSIALW